MKITVTLTKEEKEKTLERLWIDPCKEIKCGEMDCAGCPFEKEIANFTKARNELRDKIRATKVEEE